MRRTLPILLLALAGPLAAQGPTIDPRNLNALASPADGDVIPVWPISGGQAKKATWGGLRSGFLTAVGTYTLASGGAAPIRWLTEGSAATGATNEGLRSSMFSLFDTRTTSIDGAAMTMDCSLTGTPGVGTLTRTCLHIKSFFPPDNGGDVSGLLIACPGGGPCATMYKAQGLAPAGAPDYHTSPQPALEVGTSDYGPAAIFSAGVNAWGPSNRNHALEVRMGAAAGANQSDGFLIWPTNDIFDSRIALAIGSPQQNAAPVNVTFKILANGDVVSTHTLNSAQVTTSGFKLVNDTNDGSLAALTFRKSRNNGSVATSELVGDVQWNFVNSTPAEIQGGIWRAMVADKTAGSEDLDFVLFLVKAGTLTQSYAFRSTGQFEAVSALLGGVTAQAPSLAGSTVVQLAGGTGTAPRALVDAYGSNGSLDFRRADTSAASPSAVQNGENLGQVTWSGYGASAYASGSRAAIQGKASETWTNSTQGINLSFLATPAGSATAAEVLRVEGSGHLISTGTAPSVTCTGTGTSPSAPSVVGSDANFVVTMNIGTGSPGSTGTCTVTFAVAYTTNPPPMACFLVSGAAAWGNAATVHLTTESISAPVLTWANVVNGTATALTISTSYKMSCVVIGRT